MASGDFRVDGTRVSAWERLRIVIPAASNAVDSLIIMLASRVRLDTTPFTTTASDDIASIAAPS